MVCYIVAEKVATIVVLVATNGGVEFYPFLNYF